MIHKQPYTDLDYVLLDHILSELKNMNISKVYGKPTAFAPHATRTGTRYQENACQMCVPLEAKDDNTAVARLSHLMNMFISQHIPENIYDTVQLNKNCVCKAHRDSSNVGVSTVVGLGDFTDGETIVYLNPTEHVDITRSSLTFRSQDILHGSAAFSGERYSLVFFKKKAKETKNSKVELSFEL